MQTTKATIPLSIHIVVFLAPAVLLYTVFMVIPLINSLRLSFFEIGNPEPAEFRRIAKLHQIIYRY